jgi:hypothetical protein
MTRPGYTAPLPTTPFPIVDAERLGSRAGELIRHSYTRIPAPVHLLVDRRLVFRAPMDRRALWIKDRVPRFVAKNAEVTFHFIPFSPGVPVNDDVFTMDNYLGHVLVRRAIKFDVIVTLVRLSDSDLLEFCDRVVVLFEYLVASLEANDTSG